MTSKEYVYDLTLDEALQKLDYTLYDRNCDIRVIKARQQLIDVIRKETKKLKQDSEILDILKSHIEQAELKTFESLLVDSIKYGIQFKYLPVEKEQYELIRKWLERKE